jgi:excisionase family DNA binding protein
MRMGLGVTVIRGLIEAGEIDAIRVGRRVLVVARSIDEMIERRLNEAKAPEK